MCGIFFCTRYAQEDCALLSERLKLANGARGPDSRDTRRVSLTGSDDTLVLDLFASELRLRGRDPVIQPHEQDGNIFCWNGEIFDGMDIEKDENDGVKLFHRLRTLDTVEQVASLFGSIEGPYAFVYYNPSTTSPYFLLASVSIGPDPSYEFQELPTEFIYCLELRELLKGGEIASNFDSYMTSLPRSSVNALYTQPARVNTTLPPDDWPVITGLETPDHLAQAVHDLIHQLDRSVELRVRDIPQSSVGADAARVAVLFSGGIDCTTLAYFAHKYIPLDEPIDLLNVAFENPWKLNAQTGGTKGKKKPPKQTINPRPAYMVPDRVTGLQEVEELRRLCPRVWNFVEINVPYEESQASQAIVESLMFPSRTVMDLSLAQALYFASRGKGIVRDHPNADPVPYTSPARVLLNGLGSDELLGGYGRHRSAYGTGGWKGVIDELQLEVDRIPSRNLGRDDRVISSHGKEARHPFLSLTVVSVLAGLPNISTTTGSKDLQMVSITLRVLSRPDVGHLSKIYQSLGMDYDERVLPSIGNEVLKSIVAQFDAAELITQREVVSSRIRADLLQRAGEFNIKLEDVSITHLTFGKEFTQAVEAKQIAQQDAERAKFIVEKAEQERQAAVIRAEGEAEAAATISKALERAGDAFVAFRKIEASKAIVQSLAGNPNVTYIPSGNGNVLLQVPTKK
ncbi:PHB domain-containing protein [Mycena sanguinolenta]|uniref:PHB domain-containing protein n=1 Tax=Mycena sanguinolenta TaxID=230812 RepID=A0A8H7CJD8_9AGAR|nr:PHB domain-containing protein [Mycena sanguinolenta]